MKTVIKIEIIVLAIVLLIGAALCLLADGALMWIKEPVVMARIAEPIPTDPAEPEVVMAEPVAEEKITTLPHTREITAQRYFVYDVRSGQYLQQKGELNEKLYPASITKLLSVYVMLQYLEPEETITVGDALTLVQPDSSVAWLQEGDQLTVSQLVAAMMLPSGNDAAQTAAVATGRAESDPHGGLTGICEGDEQVCPAAGHDRNPLCHCRRFPRPRSLYHHGRSADFGGKDFGGADHCQLHQPYGRNRESFGR